MEKDGVGRRCRVVSLGPLRRLHIAFSTQRRPKPKEACRSPRAFCKGLGRTELCSHGAAPRRAEGSRPAQLAHRRRDVRRRACPCGRASTCWRTSPSGCRGSTWDLCAVVGGCTPAHGPSGLMQSCFQLAMGQVGCSCSHPSVGAKGPTAPSPGKVCECTLTPRVPGAAEGLRESVLDLIPPSMHLLVRLGGSAAFWGLSPQGGACSTHVFHLSEE